MFMQIQGWQAVVEGSYQVDLSLLNCQLFRNTGGYHLWSSAAFIKDNDGVTVTWYASISTAGQFGGGIYYTESDESTSIIMQSDVGSNSCNPDVLGFSDYSEDEGFLSTCATLSIE